MDKIGGLEVTDDMMKNFYKLLERFDVNDSSSTTVQEEALLAIGHAIGSEFMRYIPILFKYLKRGLEDSNKHQLYGATLKVIGNIYDAFCRTLISSSSTLLNISVKLSNVL